MKNLIQKIIGRREKANPLSNKVSSCQTRYLRFESLEEKALLAVTTAEFNQIREFYAEDLEIWFPPAFSDCNIIEITASELSESSLRNAIDQAAPATGYNLIVVRTTETENKITLSGSELAINIETRESNVTIVSFGSMPLTIDGNQQSRLFRIEDGSHEMTPVYFGGISFTNGYSSDESGGAILGINAQLFFTRTTFTNNVSGISGGAIHVEEKGAVRISNSTTFQNNIARFGGGAISAIGDSYVGVGHGIDFIENQSGSCGGAIYAEDSTLSIGNIFGEVNFIRNTVLSEGDGYGGGVYAKNGSSNLTNVHFVDNAVLSENGGYGGGLWVIGERSDSNYGASVRLTNVNFDGNKAQWGGGLGFVNVISFVYDCSFHDNWAQFDGGGAYIKSSSLHVGNLDFRDNSAEQRGGGLFFEETGMIITSEVTAENNTVDDIYIMFNNSSIITNYDAKFPTSFRGSASRTKDSVSLRWDAVTVATGYVLQYKKTTDSDWITASALAEISTSPPGMVATITGLTANTEYIFRVQAIVEGLFVWGSITVTTNDFTVTPPLPPTNFQSTAKTSDSATLTWDAATGATGYVLQYKKASDDDWVTIPDFTGTSATVSGLAAATDYNFRIQSTNSGGSSEWSTINVTTDPIAPPSSPTNFKSTTQTANSVTLTWDAAAGATDYVLQYKKANDTDWTIAPTSTETSATVTGLTANTNYHFRLQATNDSGSSDWATTDATTNRIKLAAPTLGNVVATGSSTISVTWGAVANANGYVIQYATNTAFNVEVNTVTVDASTTSTTIDNLKANTTYYVRIMATGTGSYSNSDYSAAKPVATHKIKLAAPTLNIVFATGSSTIDVTWNAEANASSYIVQYTTDADFAAGVESVTVGSQSMTWANLTGLKANTTYYVRIMATGTGDYGNSDYSDAKSVTTSRLDTFDMPDDGTSHDWAIRKNPTENHLLEIVDLNDDSVLFSLLLETLDHLSINSSGVTNDSLTIDFSNGAFLLDNGVQFIGYENTCETISFVGTDGDDSVVLDGTKKYFNDLLIDTQNVERFILDAGTGNDQAFVVGSDSDNTLHASDNLLVMDGGGYRVELVNFNKINAFAYGTRDKTTVYGQNDSLIIMNDQYVELRSEGQSYRIWRSEQVVAINMDDSNNAIMHNGSRAFDRYTIAENYGAATNANGSYYHEWFDFENVLTISQNAKILVNSLTVAESVSFIGDGNNNDNDLEPTANALRRELLYTWLAEEQRLADGKKSDGLFDDMDWLNDFKELALRELKK